jgi:hypothetical protein
MNAYKVHIGYTRTGRDRWRTFATPADASAFCESVRQATGQILTVIAAVTGKRDDRPGRTAHMTPARRIVEKIIAKKFPNEGRYLFEIEELITIIEAVQRDARKNAIKV